MHKKLSSDLMSLAHSILQMKNKSDVLELKDKAHKLYEKLSLLAYVDEYLQTTPNAEETKEELVDKISASYKETIPQSVVETTVTETIQEIETITTEKEVEEDIVEENIVEQSSEITEQPFDELEKILAEEPTDTKFDEASFIGEKVNSLDEELKDTLSVDVTADLFSSITPQKSLNDRLHNNIQIGLNDRIAFVKNLFEGSSADFNRVVSQLNTFDSEKEAKHFINKTVKPDYDWSEKQEYLERFIAIIERRFN